MQEELMSKSENIKLRVQPEEKEAFQEAAEIAGIDLSTWIRERLRRSARVELQEAGREIPFFRKDGEDK
jgi:uncharacterized protein (DUF1778 family)